MERIFLYKETVAAIMKLYKYKKEKKIPLSRWRHRLLWYCSRCAAPYRFLICLYYVLSTSIDLMKENGFTQAKERNRRYPSHTSSGKFTRLSQIWLHILEQVAGGIGLLVNEDKPEDICFNQWCNISTLKGSPLKPVEKFTHLGSRVS